MSPITRAGRPRSETSPSSFSSDDAIQSKTQVPSREQEELSCLYEIAQALSRTRNLRSALEAALGILARMLGMTRGAISILNSDNSELQVEIAPGLSSSARMRGRYKVGEGITGHVVATGEPVVVPRVSQDPRFLNRTQSRGDILTYDLSFLCVPVNVDGRTIGALSVDRPFSDTIRLEEDLRFLTILSGLIAQTVGRLQAFEAERETLITENRSLRRALAEKYEIGNFIGRSGRVLDVLEMVARVAGSNATVLLRGESGTGKSLIAKAIHYNSPRRERPFVTVNCSALPEGLMESELFGHEKGAFTGASARKIGRFEAAEGGTIFLDEIGELSHSVQVKLLHVIQEREFQRLGGVKSIRSDVRIVAATNRDLEEALKQGEFREDLYYRLNVFPIYLPPLRERKTDITLLAEHFLERFSRENGKAIRRLSSAAIDLLMAYHWPGNVRELQNCMERAVLVCDEDVIRSFHLPPTLQGPKMEGNEGRSGQSLFRAVEQVERDLIIDALKETGGSQARAAGLLETSPRVLHYKIHKYGIDPNLYKMSPRS